MTKMHGKHTRIYIDGYDLSGDFNSFEPGYAADTAEVSGFSDEIKKYVVGLADPDIRMAGLFSDGTVFPLGAHPVLSNRVASDVMIDGLWGTLPLQRGAGGTVGMKEYSTNSEISGAVAMSAGFSGGGSSGGVFEFIQSLLGKQAVPGTAAAVDQDTGAAFTNGLSGHLQLFSGTGTIAIMSSASGAGPWTSRINFGLQTAPIAVRATAAGFAGANFLRAGMVSGTGTAWVGFKRL